MKIRPLHDRVIVKRLEEERTTASGIVIPESASAEKPDQGTIEAIGNGKVLEDGSIGKSRPSCAVYKILRSAIALLGAAMIIFGIHLKNAMSKIP